MQASIQRLIDFLLRLASCVFLFNASDMAWSGQVRVYITVYKSYDTMYANTESAPKNVDHYIEHEIPTAKGTRSPHKGFDFV